MALSNNQLLMLDNLIYTDRCANGRTVAKIIELLEQDIAKGKNIDEDGITTNDEWSQLIENIKDEPDLLNYTVQEYEDNEDTGMRAACFVDDVNHPTDVNVVFRGTSGDYEWHDNGEGGYLSDTEQQKAAVDYVNELPREYGSITVTGHSKGGNKAQYVTIVADPDRVDRCVSFDGQGFSEEFLEKYAEQIEERKYRIESISASDDFVNCLLYSIAGIKTYVLTEEQDEFIYYHKPNILLDENGELRPSGEQAPLSKFINEYTTYIISNVPEPQRSAAIDGLVAIMEDGKTKDKETIWQTIYGGATAVSYLDNFAFDSYARLIFGPKSGVQLTRDFSDASKQKMFGLVTQVESEKWGDFTDWVGDRWYDFESWIGTLNIRHYIDNVNSYHKKVIDKNNATEQKIKDIFEAVHGVDSSYSTTLGNITTNLTEWRRFIDTLSDIVEPGKGRFNSQYISGKLNEVLSDISVANVQRIRDTLVQQVNGEPLFDEELLLEYVKKSPGQMTDDEKTAVLGVIEELQETVAFYESAATLGDDQFGAAFWNRAAWVSETNKFASFSAVSAHYNQAYVNLLEACLEQGEDSNTFAAALLKVSNGEDALSLLGVDISEDVSKIFGSSSIAAYAAKWKTEHSESYFGKLQISESEKFGSKNGIDGFNDWIKDKLETNDKYIEEKDTFYLDEDGNEIEKTKDTPTFYDKELTLGEISEEVSASVSIYDGSFDVGENGKIDITVGKAEAHAGVSAGFYVIGANGEKKFSPGVNAEIGASVTAFEAEWEQQWIGDKNLGLNTEVGVTAGKAEAKADVGAQIFSEDGTLDVQLGASASAEAIAAEAEASVGVNVLGGEVGVTGGVNFGIGAHAEVGYRDGVFKCDVGASLGVGVSLDVEVDVGGMVDGVCDAAEAVGDFVDDAWNDVKDGWNDVKDGWNDLWSW